MELTQVTENKELMEQLSIMFNPAPRYMNKKEACKYMGICYRTFQKAIAEGLPAVQIGGVLRFDRLAIDDYLKNKRI
ncbi:helix-turn-helix domain-containing protein [Pediococcus pentosaceus]|jgi:excisionase family DNA binding protein|uniref:helix-turn-helix domain-containing protein n=1 Tax=Pediococcus pentosaceus TaxID=1255 RepID=UPI0008531D93|nr:helix-turn-helix domain-containing protein [Pediococcus pentosaceus]MBF7131609.1 helix-turn-helix domain-containing protein [Pediococcus pentosaceus]MCS8563899.1 DNA-binding protein [Pediococcus pentosaceus]MCS8568194.1 DNA-binding protein [Pediococcus pentosaceus]MCS8573086.1 DNA-binding protein [Pediococcus pentosaceus]MCS8580836.1 DNA-binding protein [Pediococcus pentosaceus]